MGADDSEQQKLAAWVDKALGTGKHGKTVKGLARALKVTSAAVSRMRQGMRAIKAHEIHIIEDYLGERAPGFGISSADTRQLTDIRPVVFLPVDAMIAPSVWREVGTPVNSAMKAAALPDPDLAGLRQYSCSVEDDPNRMVICVPFSEVRVHPHDGDLVHVVRVRGNLEEHTLCVVRSVNGVFMLAPEKNPSAKPVKIPRAGDKTYEIRGLVVGDLYRRKH